MSDSSSEKPTTGTPKRKIPYDSLFRDADRSAHRKARAILYLSYSQDENKEVILALVPRTLEVKTSAFAAVANSGDHENVGVVEKCKLPGDVFGRITLQDDVEPEEPPDVMPHFEAEGRPIDPDIRVSEEVYVVNDEVPKGAEAQSIGYVVASNAEVALRFDDSPSGKDQNINDAPKYQVVPDLHVIQTTSNRFLDLMGRILRNRRTRDGVIGAVIAANPAEKQLIVAPLPVISDLTDVSLYTGTNKFGLEDDVDRSVNDQDAFDDFVNSEDGTSLFTDPDEDDAASDTPEDNV